LNHAIAALSRRLGIGFLLFIVFFLAGCASSGFSVRSDEDPSADFRQYKTWNFFETMGIEGGYNSPEFGEYFREAIKREMNSRGYRQADNPDLLINVTFRTDDKVEMKSYTAPYMSGAYYHRPGGPYYGSALGAGVGVSRRAVETIETSVFLDLVDNSNDRIAWQGVAVVEASDQVAQHLRDAIYTAVNRIFDLYPYTAGD
jgi:hypothetical protein